MTQNQHLDMLLTELEQALKQVNLWQQTRPSAQALASTQPFCIDTLSFEQWLQFIFIEKMRILLQTKQALPTTLALLPLAEEVYKNSQFDKQILLNVIVKIDNVFAP
ncbi:YqcC family protein [Catenovulum sp. 2E275]|uniref:YqcC family protein n=1 Tax=Catenovulum sp. 2E275 TaxID=2980497 RepID=UPI0021D16FD3|nr:YqcC family protein [Catenovulum sp. 2E275]MCU4676960.1 YqcC family protein [Catenovulum sp. 2E275]